MARLTFSALAALALLTACGGAAPAASSGAAVSSSAAAAASKAAAAASQAKPAASGAAAKVRSAWVALTTGQAPTWMAQDGGYFAKYGLDVDLQYIEGSAKTTAAMIGGSVDNAEMAGEATVVAQTKGATDLVIIAGYNNYSPFKLVTWDPAVKTIQDLKGRTVATSQGGSADEFILNKLLALNGMTAKDLKVTYMQGGDPARLTALQAHQIDAAMDSVPWDRLAVKQGNHILVDSVALKIPSPQNTLVTTRTYLKTHQTETMNFLKASAAGIYRFKKDEAFAKQTIRKWIKTEDQDYIDGAWESFSLLMPDDLRLTPDAVQAVLDQDKITGHKPEEFMDMSLVDQLNSSGFFKTL
jgi:ABC-type nitrate/sulfonate/bicarbonate transport system substrate-binding protein